MPKYRVTLAVGGTVTVEVEASSEAAAMNVALELDPFDVIDGGIEMVDQDIFWDSGDADVSEVDE